jgi:hypothetical protein
MITNVTPQTAVTANDIRDIKPPVPIPNGWEWVWWTLGALAVLAILYFAWRYWQKRRSQIHVEPPLPAHIRAKQMLEKALELIAQPKPFCILVSDTVRVYLEERFNFRAPDRTTEEFLRELNATDLLLPEQKESLGKFLESCDLVKFAKYEPGENELRGLHGSAVRLVEETEEKADSETRDGESDPRMANEVVNHGFPGEPASAFVGTSNVRRFSKAQVFATVGVVLQLAPMIWVIDYYASIYRYFKSIMDMPASLSKDGVGALTGFLSQEFALANHESWLFNLILTAMAIGLVGLVILVFTLISLRYRAEWFFWFLIIYGVMLCGSFPFGTIFGVFFLVYCLTKRREFLRH